MGFAGKKMGEAERIAVASSLFVVKSDDSKRGELIGLCPIHGESNPSFSYNFIKDVYFCQSCQATGDLVKLWCHVKGIADQKEGFKEFCLALNIDRDDGLTPAPMPAKKKKKDIPVISESVWERMQPLPKTFVARLVELRRWNQDAIDKLDLRLQCVYLAKDGSIKDVTRAERIAIPVRNEKGDLVNIRLYKPGAKTGKIMSWGKGYGSAQLFPAKPLREGWPVLICEGEPDTISAIAYGFNAITQTSKLVNWPENQKKQFSGLDVVIAYDADQAGQDYGWKAAKSLSGTARSIKLLQWPESMGCVAGYWPENHGQDLTDFLKKHGRSAADLKKLIDNAVVYTPDPETKKGQVVNKSTSEIPKPMGGVEFFHKNAQGRWTFKPRWLANRLMVDLQLLYTPLSSMMYRYNDTYWEDFQEEHLETSALRYLGDEATSSRAADSAKQARLLSIIPHGRETNDSGMMCLVNGMLDISDIKTGNVDLKPHDKEHYATYQLPISYSVDTDRQCERWLQFLNETIQTKEVIMQVQEFAGYCLTRETRYGKALVLLGPGSDGKSKFIEVIELLVGERNFDSVSLHDLEDQFYRSGLYNKMLCTSTEISKEYFDSKIFKAIVTGDTISAAHKNKDPFKFKPFCKCIFAGNDLPRSRDNSDGYFRRLLPVRFKKQFFGEDEDKHLAEKFETELSEIFKWALSGLWRLMRNDGFTKSDETNELIHQYRMDNNPVMAFIDTKCTLGENYEVDKDGLFRKYRDFCEQYNYRALNNSNFFTELSIAKRNLIPIRPRREGKRPYMLKGIGLILEDT